MPRQRLFRGEVRAKNGREAALPATRPTIGAGWARRNPRADLPETALPATRTEALMVTEVDRESVTIQGPALSADLVVPGHARGLVLIAHRSGSCRRSVRSRRVAGWLQQSGLATLVFNLLTEAEVQDRSKVLDMALLGRRIILAMEWVAQRPDLAHLKLGLFGASTGAAAALVAAAQMPRCTAAVVAGGGRPDLAPAMLPRVRAATLLIVGGRDTEVLALNRQALRALPGEKRLEVVPGATHLFEEPGTLESMAVLAAEWFGQHLSEPHRA